MSLQKAANQTIGRMVNIIGIDGQYDRNHQQRFKLQRGNQKTHCQK